MDCYVWKLSFNKSHLLISYYSSRCFCEHPKLLLQLRLDYSAGFGDVPKATTAINNVRYTFWFYILYPTKHRGKEIGPVNKCIR